MKKYSHIPEYIRNLPLPILQRLRLERMYHNVARPINSLLGRRDYGKISFNPLIFSNRFYGNEYIFMRYAGINEDLFAIIEHGLYFGNNTKKIPYEHEWELGGILTYGDYRKKIINQVYPNYFCDTIGTPILYADSEKVYQQEIINNLKISGKVLLFFPAHGLENLAPKFNADALTNQLISIARDNDCKNIIVCTYLSGGEFYESLRKKAKDIEIFAYSCGSRFDQEFLLRQRALISLSTVTASNSLGTHVGNCVGLQKPHVILKQEITYEGDVEKEFGEQTRSANWKEQFAIEKELFENMFPYTSGQLTLTKEQYDLCDYYWGFSKKKTPEEIRELYRKCYEHALEFIKSNNQCM